MAHPDGDDPLLDALLAATPERVLNALLPAGPAVRAELDARRATLALLAAALEPLSPSPALRERIVALSRTPRPVPRAAVLVLDMIEDYLTPGRPLHVPRALHIVPALAARLAQARAANIPVLFACDHHEADDPELRVWPAHACAGTTGWQVVAPLAPCEGEPVLKHPTYSAFVHSELEQTLRSLGVQHLVLTGCATELGLFATATDALMRGFSVEVPPETQAGVTEQGEQTILRTLSLMVPYANASAR